MIAMVPSFSCCKRTSSQDVLQFQLVDKITIEDVRGKNAAWVADLLYAILPEPPNRRISMLKLKLHIHWPLGERDLVEKW